eukprot:Hpha_TRINITY_DN35504_c0_g1::TRINITY_DN35504_c0_g1_i1::g.84614::m.84614/K00933/E2.7.3.2; creatine kinase
MTSYTPVANAWYAFVAAGAGGLAYYRVHGKKSYYDSVPDMTSNHTVMSKVLTAKMYNTHAKEMTPSRFTFDRCIQPGLECPGDPLATTPAPGIAAGDRESYFLFGDLFDRVIEQFHGVQLSKHDFRTDLHPDTEFDVPELSNRSVRQVILTASRNVHSIPFAPSVTRGQRRVAMQRIEKALSRLEGEFKGQFKPLRDWDLATLSGMTEIGLAFSKHAAEPAVAAGYNRDWPDGRGLFVNPRRSLAVWVNEKNHIRVVSRGAVSEIQDSFKRLAEAVNNVERGLAGEFGTEQVFVRDSKRGYLGPDVAEIGPAFSVTFELALPALATDPTFNSTLRKAGLVCAPGGDPEKHIFWITQRERMVGTESEQLKKTAQSVADILRRERELAFSTLRA